MNTATAQEHTMTATTTRVTNSDFEQADGLVNLVNDALDSGFTVTFNGETVTREFGHMRPATLWQSGSVSVTVKGRTARTGTRWLKRGQTATVTVTE
jgi:hypothetical protein